MVPNASSPTYSSVLIDLSANISSFGDLGLSSIEWHPDSGGQLYVLYAVNNPLFGDACPEDGIQGNRTSASITGCPIQGRFSRFPVSNGVVLGPEVVLIGGNNEWCRCVGWGCIFLAAFMNGSNASHRGVCIFSAVAESVYSCTPLPLPVNSPPTA